MMAHSQPFFWKPKAKFEISNHGRLTCEEDFNLLFAPPRSQIQSGLLVTGVSSLIAGHRCPAGVILIDLVTRAGSLRLDMAVLALISMVVVDCSFSFCLGHLCLD